MTRRTRFLLLPLVLSGGCARGEAADVAANDRAHETQDHAAEVAVAVDTSLARREPGELRAVAAAVVTGRSGPGDKPFEVALRTPTALAGHARRFGTRTLSLQLRTRTPDLTQYPCTSCHVGSKLVQTDKRIADAHAGLRVVHPQETGATCTTCHAPENVEMLALRNAERVPLDHAYRVCAQCHAPQVDAWAAGGHGKRLDGWQGRRVVMGCADCHDPHAPALEARTPFRAPRLQRPGKQTP